MAECVYLDLPALPLAFLPAENLIRTPEFPQLGFAPDITPFAPLLREAAAQNKVLYCARPALSETMFVGQRKVISNKAIVDYYRSQGERRLKSANRHRQLMNISCAACRIPVKFSVSEPCRK